MPASVREVDFEEVQEAWEHSLPSCATNTVYVTPWWQRTWWTSFGEGSELHLLRVEHDGAMIGIAPLRLRDGVLSFVGGQDLCDYNDFIVVRGRESEFYPAVWARIKELQWEVLDLRSLPYRSPTLLHVPTLAKKDGLGVESEEEDKAPVCSLPSTWEEFVAGLDKKRRHELRRKLRRLEAAGEKEQHTLTGPQEVSDGMADFFRLMRASAEEKNAFLTPERERFFSAVSVELAKRDQLRLSFMNLDGHAVASNISIDYAGAYLLYNSGYDPAYSQLAVGLVNTALTIKEAIELGRGRFEFLRGTERYKYDLGATDTSVYTLVVRR